jgi:hypothetical protein
MINQKFLINAFLIFLTVAALTIQSCKEDPGTGKKLPPENIKVETGRKESANAVQTQMKCFHIDLGYSADDKKNRVINSLKRRNIMFDNKNRLFLIFFQRFQLI